ncbi:hypothetical protein BVC80_1633g2 [Macleaya cordata]|uniref:Uncharacterized protein n=1 Tax=Macleaya cordata TaxID=56857 RepID=A0A200PPT4_MACCD|nr:hypothetical protein BVC80_1633g2 [Macleaya cordata]
MAEEKESTSMPLSQRGNPEDPEDPAKSPPTSPNSTTRKVSSDHRFLRFLLSSFRSPSFSLPLSRIFTLFELWHPILSQISS